MVLHPFERLCCIIRERMHENYSQKSKCTNLNLCPWSFRCPLFHTSQLIWNQEINLHYSRLQTLTNITDLHLHHDLLFCFYRMCRVFHIGGILMPYKQQGEASHVAVWLVIDWIFVNVCTWPTASFASGLGLQFSHIVGFRIRSTLFMCLFPVIVFLCR